jgi:hypothetical protein
MAILHTLRKKCNFSITPENYVIPRAARDPQMQAPSYLSGDPSLLSG